MKILIIVPAYNEEENILSVCKQLESKKEYFDFIVINDCSTDNTLKILEENNINHINLPYNLGIGGAVQTGYKYAFEYNYDIAIQFDGDGQHDVEYIQHICEPIISHKANLVIGSRYLDDKTSEFKSTFMRRLGNKIISWMIRKICKVKITDATSGFRAADRKTIKLFCEKYDWKYPEPISLVNAIKANLVVQEKSVNMKYRLGGRSSIKISNSIGYMLQVLINIII